MSQRPFLNLGCGRIILPAPKPSHYGLIDDAVTSYALWHNVDRNPQPGVDEVVDVFRYPFHWADNSFDGALVAHVSEHIPHETRFSAVNDAGHDEEFLIWSRRRDRIADLQDGWWAFWAEVWRILTPGAIVHVLSPYATSTGAMVDPSHTRYLMPASFMHSMAPDPNSPFQYANGGCHFEITEPWRFSVHQDYGHLTQPGREQELARAVEHDFNVVIDFYLKLRVVK